MEHQTRHSKIHLEEPKSQKGDPQHYGVEDGLLGELQPQGWKGSGNPYCSEGRDRIPKTLRLHGAPFALHARITGSLGIRN